MEKKHSLSCVTENVAQERFYNLLRNKYDICDCDCVLLILILFSSTCTVNKSVGTDLNYLNDFMFFVNLSVLVLY